jgi:hypothetical protein|tara:strand:- start:372 stop:737 length:366 start_codon:yes stop_codon:yes gene_type:complete
MSTRATIRFATREEGVTFNEHPKKWHAQFYKHHDGYPEGLGLDIADSILNYSKLDNWELEHVDVVHGDIEYMYYVWQDHGKDIWISIFEMHQWSDKDAECIFVGTPEKLINKYKQNTNYDG